MGIIFCSVTSEYATFEFDVLFPNSTVLCEPKWWQWNRYKLRSNWVKLDRVSGLSQFSFQTAQRQTRVTDVLESRNPPVRKNKPVWPGRGRVSLFFQNRPHSTLAWVQGRIQGCPEACCAHPDTVFTLKTASASPPHRQPTCRQHLAPASFGPEPANNTLAR